MQTDEARSEGQAHACNWATLDCVEKAVQFEAMSFESVFEKWLRKKDKAGVKEKEPGKGQQLHVADDDPGGEKAAGKSTQEIQQEVWHKENAQGTPLLPKGNDLSRVEGSRMLRSSPHPQPLHTSMLCTDTQAVGRQCNHSPEPLLKPKSKNTNAQTSQTLTQSDTNVEKLNLTVSRVPVTEECKRILSCHQCRAQLPVTELTPLTQLSHTTSPTTISRGQEMDLVLSPGREVPMEPDSTSEVLTGFARCGKLGKQGYVRLRKVSPHVAVSPCSTACARDAAVCGGVVVHAEESQAECDSTSLLLASPSAISPASQGEIEERVCPILSDREDGASPAHCVCQCRALCPHCGLMPRDHLPVTPKASPSSVASPHPTTITDSSTTGTSTSKSKTSLVQHDRLLRPDQEMLALASRPGLKAEPVEDVLKSESKSSHVLCSKEEQTFGFGILVDPSNNSKAECVQRNNSSSAEVKGKDGPLLLKCTPVLLPRSGESTVANVRHCANSRPAKLTLSDQEASRKNAKKQAEVCDFAKNIDWDSAVAETVESPSSMVECDGESKPGIILKIRTKAVVQCLEPSPPLRPPKRSVVLKRKGHSVDTPEIMSRLRKRQKSGEVQKSENQDSSELSEKQKRTDSCKGSQTQSNCSSCSDHSVARNRRRRRNTVQLGGDLKPYTEHLSSTDRRFVESSTKLSQLQTQMYDLVCSLFPLLRLQLSHTSPESHQFTKIIDDIIGSLQRSETEDTVEHCEDLCNSMEKLRLGGYGLVPVFSPQVVLCGSPQHSLEEFQDRVCTLLQLLLPDVTVSFSDTLSQTADPLEALLKRMIAANSRKATRKNQRVGPSLIHL